MDSPATPMPACSLPLLTASWPGLGGRIKVEPEDFVVEEIPAYVPSGSGEHLFLWIEKRDVAPDHLLGHLSRALGIRREEIGMAGLKDRRAVTRQFVSVPAAAESRVAAADSDQIRVLSAVCHGNKLRTGHLRGNRFDILIRDVSPDSLHRALSIIAALQSHGLPNYYGEQRFGLNGETLSLGLDLLSGRRTERDIPRPQRRFLLRLALSSVQSHLFNEVLAARMEAGELSGVLLGDVMQVVASGGCFIAEDIAREQTRYDAREIVPTGPIFGPKMKSPQGLAVEREMTILERSGLRQADFRRYPKLLPGTRRPLVVWPEDLDCAADPSGLRVKFSLPSGSYATVLLREIMKCAALNHESGEATVSESPAEGVPI
jgi:tRNA pseudouridine13 synthase